MAIHHNQNDQQTLGKKSEKPIQDWLSRNLKKYYKTGKANKGSFEQDTNKDQDIVLSWTGDGIKNVKYVSVKAFNRCADYGWTLSLKAKTQSIGSSKWADSWWYKAEGNLDYYAFVKGDEFFFCDAKKFRAKVKEWCDSLLEEGDRSFQSINEYDPTTALYKTKVSKTSYIKVPFQLACESAISLAADGKIILSSKAMPTDPEVWGRWSDYSGQGCSLINPAKEEPKPFIIDNPFS